MDGSKSCTGALTSLGIADSAVTSLTAGEAGCGTTITVSSYSRGSVTDSVVSFSFSSGEEAVDVTTSFLCTSSVGVSCCISCRISSYSSVFGGVAVRN